VLSALALPRLVRRHGGIAVAFLLTAGPVVAIHAKMIWWSGDWAWGPRYLVFAVPALLLPGALLVGDLLERGRRRWLPAVAALGLAGVGVQLLGSAFYWDHYIRIAQEARSRWLGVPNRGGALPWNRGDACDPCFEDLHPFVWMPPFQPIEGHLWLARHVLRKDGWAAAEADAPWHRYTKLTLDISGSYARARIDWWYDELAPRFARGARLLLVAMILGLLASAALWAWRGRALRGPP
jgi:hypothetical protein